jgi:hypothetical protein
MSSSHRTKAFEDASTKAESLVISALCTGLFRRSNLAHLKVVVGMCEDLSIKPMHPPTIQAAKP